MSQLSPQARRLFELAQDADDPGELERARVAHLLTGRLAQGGGTPTPRARIGAGPKVLGASFKPALLALGLGGALAVGGLLASPRGGAVSSPPAITSTAPAAPTSASDAAGAARSAGAAPAPLANAPDRASGMEPEPAQLEAHNEASAAKPETSRRTTTAERGASARATVVEDDATSDAEKRHNVNGSAAAFPLSQPAGAQKVDPSAAPAVDPLRAEAEALREAQRALRNGQAQSALELLAAQDARFAGGLLAEERAAARVLSLCQAGLAARARLEATHFAARWPRSALLSRVQAACVGE